MVAKEINEAPKITPSFVWCSTSQCLLCIFNLHSSEGTQKYKCSTIIYCRTIKLTISKSNNTLQYLLNMFESLSS